MDQFAANRSFLETEAFLSKRHPERTRELELVKRVASLKAKAKCYRLPTDVDRLAREAGIVTIRFVPLATRGRLLREPGGFVAEVNSVLPATQRRFVIAHETTHLLVEKELMLTTVGRPQRSKAQLRLVERLCDFGAREILLPINSLRNEIAEAVPSMQTVCRISAEAQCSFEITAERICEHPAIWDACRFIFWTKHKDRLLAVRTLPENGVDAEQIVLEDESNSVVMKALKASGVVRGWQVLSYAGRAPERFYMEAVASEEGQVVSLRLFKPPPKRTES
ncbi:MAG: ImmA/IrrE family metallo-endopeptidase [Verrucomicrobia bacterium]|nr:ImmA/IrrE family metallo-endopeptidase [Verrucomicrobiota bacterium]